MDKKVMAMAENGTGTKPSGVSQTEYEDQVKAMLRRGGPPGGGFSPYPGFREATGSIEDRRNEPVPGVWDAGRMLDPTPLEKSIRPQFVPPQAYYAKDLPVSEWDPVNLANPKVPLRMPNQLEKDAGAMDLIRGTISHQLLLKMLGMK
jgi:hypothetical protein